MAPSEPCHCSTSLPVQTQQFLPGVLEEQFESYWQAGRLCYSDWRESPHAHTILWIEGSPIGLVRVLMSVCVHRPLRQV